MWLCRLSPLTQWTRPPQALARERQLPYARSRQIIEAIRERHKPIARALCIDAGVRLMNLDSQIAMAVTTRLNAQAVTCIPVHDSIIAPLQYDGQTRDEMKGAWERISGKLNLCGIK